MDDATIISKIRLRGYPTDIDDDEIKEAIRGAIQHVIERVPYEKYGTFNTVNGQQDYNLFSAGGAFEGGLEIVEVLGRVAGDADSTDPFGLAPFLQNLGFNPGASEWFTNPGDLMIYDSNWAEYANRFGRVSFESLTTIAGGGVRIIPAPQSAQTLLAKYTVPLTEIEIRATNEEWFLRLVESFVCRVLARRYAQVAGIKTGLHADSGLTMKYYQGEADRLLVESMDNLPFQMNAGLGIRS